MYSLDLLLKFNMNACKEYNFPFLSGIKLGEVGDSPLVESSLYRQLVGSLLYIIHYQPDLAYDVGVLARYIHHPNSIHWNTSKMILHYLQGTKHFRVHYVVGSPLELMGFSYSDWAGDPNDRNTTSSYVFMLSNGHIFCSSKKKHTISLSSAEAEYRGAVNATTQCVWLQGNIRELDAYLIHPLSFGVTIKVQSIFLQI